MTYLGDIDLGDTIHGKFTTVQSTGAPSTLSGSPVLSVYPDNSTTQITAGVVLTADFDSVTGFNAFEVVATSGNGYSAGTNLAIVITSGTVNSVDVAGYTVAHFSITNRSPLRPTTAGRTLDVSSGGEAGVDWANVGSPTTSVSLSNTTIGPVVVATNNDKSGYGVDWSNISNATSSVSLSNTTIGPVVVATNNDKGGYGVDWSNVSNATSSISLSNTTIGPVVVATNNDKSGYALSASQTFDLTGDITGDLSGSVGSVTGNVGGSVASMVEAGRQAVADSILGRNIASGSDGGRDVTSALQRLRNRVQVVLSTGTVYAENDTTEAWTFTIGTTSAVSINDVNPT